MTIEPRPGEKFEVKIRWYDDTRDRYGTETAAHWHYMITDLTIKTKRFSGVNSYNIVVQTGTCRKQFEISNRVKEAISRYLKPIYEQDANTIRLDF